MTERSSSEPPVHEPDDGTAAIAGLTEDVLPALIARLRASRLGELEVRSDGWRVRLRRDPSKPQPVRSAIGSASASVSADDGSLASPRVGVARSPAVGYFSRGRDVDLGAAVRAGDSLGAVDMLGIVQDVPAPIDGFISAILAESGQAVEYGQALVDIDPLAVDGSQASEADIAIDETDPVSE